MILVKKADRFDRGRILIFQTMVQMSVTDDALLIFNQKRMK
jgi:hypothetical protein